MAPYMRRDGSRDALDRTNVWTKIPSNPYASIEQQEKFVSKSFSEGTRKRYRGRNSDPESPPSQGVDPDCLVEDLQLTAFGKQRRSWLKLVLKIFAIICLLLLLGWVLWNQRGMLQTSLPPKTMIKGHVFGGHKHQFVDIKICDTRQCHADCHSLRMDSTSHSVITGPYGTRQSSSGILQIACDRDYYISIAVCDNPGQVVDSFPPHYSLYHDEHDDELPTPEQICAREYPPEGQVHVDFRHAVNTTMYLDVCADGKAQPDHHRLQCAPSESLPGIVPRGSFRGSCERCMVIETNKINQLRCECKSADGTSTDTRLSDPYGCKGIENIDGCLQCEMFDDNNRDAEVCARAGVE